MSSGDFEVNLRQSVADHIALIRNAANAAKARIGQSVEAHQAEAPVFDRVHETPPPRPAVNFAFDDADFGEVDAEGIPVWEEPQ
jgi:hypothetical protein